MNLQWLSNFQVAAEVHLGHSPQWFTCTPHGLQLDTNSITALPPMGPQVEEKKGGFDFGSLLSKPRESLATQAEKAYANEAGEQSRKPALRAFGTPAAKAAVPKYVLSDSYSTSKVLAGTNITS